MTTVGWAVGMIRMGVPLANAIELPGTGNNYLSTPDSVANTINGDIDMLAWIGPDSWTPAWPGQILWAKGTATGLVSWQLTLLDSGKPLFVIGSPFSSGGAVELAESTEATGFTDGTYHWVRVTQRRSDGRTQFFTSANGSSWTQLGADVTIGSYPGVADTEGPVTIGARSDGGGPFNGVIRYAELRDGIGGTIVHYFDPAAVTKLGTRDPSTVAAGGPWTISGALWDWVLV